MTTTTDPFTEAARAEAERRWPYSANPDPTPAEDEGAALSAGFVDGAEWARTHLAAQEPTTSEVKALQDCLYERTLTWVPGVEVRAALSAARATRRDEENR